MKYNTYNSRSRKNVKRAQVASFCAFAYVYVTCILFSYLAAISINAFTSIAMLVW